jgi:tripartite-type tricarboxylate transporter receptor subunit TctC
MKRRSASIVLLAASLAAVVGLNTAAPAQSFPSRPLRRLLAQKLSEALKQPVVVENRPGAGGNIGVEAVAKAPADGHTLGISATNSFAINPHLTKNLPYDAQKDLVQVSMIGVIPNVIVVGAEVPAKSIAELVELAKKQPLAYASPGQGTSLHLAGEMLNDAAGINLTHVPYKGDVPALQDVIGGRVPVMTSNLSSVLPHIRADKLRALAVTTARRAAQLPDVPTMAESGYRDFDISVWFSLFTAAATPRDALETLNRETQRALNAADLRERLTAANIEPRPTGLDEMRTFVQKEYERWGAIVRKTGATWD